MADAPPPGSRPPPQDLQDWLFAIAFDQRFRPPSVVWPLPDERARPPEPAAEPVDSGPTR